MFTKHEERNNDPLPDSFATAEEAGEFWDTHSLTDYEEHLEAADDVAFEISEPVFKCKLPLTYSGNYKKKLRRRISRCRKLLMRF